MKKLKNASELKDELERVTGQQIARGTWLRLDESGHIADYLKGHDSFETLVELTREALHYQEENRRDWQEGWAFNFSEIMSDNIDSEQPTDSKLSRPLKQPVPGDYV